MWVRFCRSCDVWNGPIPPVWRGEIILETVGCYLYEFGLGFFWRLIINSFVLVMLR